MSDEKVIDFKTRKPAAAAGPKSESPLFEVGIPFEGVDEQIDPIKDPKVCAVTVMALEQALEMAKTGQITGLTMLTRDVVKGGFARWVVMPSRYKDWEGEMFKFLGAQALIKTDLEQMASQRYVFFDEHMAELDESGS